MAAIAEKLVEFVRQQYRGDELVPLHAPQFEGREKEYLSEAIDSTMVSTIGSFVVEFENRIAEFTQAKYAVAVCNGTAALHLALMSANVGAGDEVITQSLTFIATCNAIHYCGARPVFVDVERESLGLCPRSLREFLECETTLNREGVRQNKKTGRDIRACVPVHNLGHPARIDEIKEVCTEFQIALIEDAAEALGSRMNGKHVGTFGQAGVISFNGNKIITTGGGGMVLTNSEEIAIKVRHLSTTAKLPHPWLYVHDEVGFNYRMPNLNAAVGCAQVDVLDRYIDQKRALASKYADWCAENDLEFFSEAKWGRSNYWLNAFFARSKSERDSILEGTNSRGIMTRPMWTPMHTQRPFKDAQKQSLQSSEDIESRLICVPSSPVR